MKCLKEYEWYPWDDDSDEEDDDEDPFNGYYATPRNPEFQKFVDMFLDMCG